MSRRPRIAHLAMVDLTHRFLLLGQLRRLRDEGYDVTAISAPGPWTTELVANGIHHVAWGNATRSWAPGKDLRALAELVAILRRGRYDVVHTHTPKAGLMGRVAARVAGVPCVVNTVHGFYATPEDRLPKRTAVLGVEWLASRFSDLELYQSSEDLGWARRTGVARPGKSILLGNGTDLSRFHPRSFGLDEVRRLRTSLGIPEDALVVGTIGRLVEEKGYRELFAAARSVRDRVANTWFVALGDTDASREGAIGPQEMAAQGDRFLFPGWQEDVRPYLALMDVFVLPSWREGLPRSAIEAAAMGLPLVLTDIRGCREVVSDGVEGVLVPVRDSSALAEAIVRLLDDSELRHKMGEAARNTAVDRFDERRVVDLIAGVSRSLLERKGLLARPPGSVVVRRARRSDVHSLAALHGEIREGFLPTLGAGFLRQLYRSMVDDPQAVVLVAEGDRGRVMGFVAGTSSVRRLYRRFMVRRGIVAAIVAAPRLVRNGAFKRAMETARYPDGMAGLPEAELLSIAVGREWRDRGVGGELTRRLLDELGRLGAPEVKVVVGATNEKANALYRRIGFQPRAQITVHRGEPSNVLVSGSRG